MNQSEFYKEAQAIFAFKLPEGTLLDLFKLANDYAASYIPDHRMVGDQYKGKIYHNYLTKHGFEDDSWPNYEGWFKEYDDFNLLIYISSRNNGDYKFDILTAIKGVRAASDPSGENKHMFHTVSKDKSFEKVKKLVEFFDSMTILK